MSNTRHATTARALSQERYMSSPEYSELRGISGNAVTAKAALMAHPAKRSLLFFLQAMSLREGGLKKFSRDFLAGFPDRIGTITMHKTGIKPGGKYDGKTAAQIYRELYPVSAQEKARQLATLSIMAAQPPPPLDEFGKPEKQPSRKSIPPLPQERIETPVHVDELLIECRKQLANLESFIIELCINPKLQFRAPGETSQSMEGERIALEESLSEIKRSDMGLPNESDFSTASLPCFKDIIGALFEFKHRYEETARSEFVLTEVGDKIFETLDVGLDTGKMVVIEGNSRIGKTTATEAWCNMRLGEARLISLSGITHKTGFFRALARVLGIGGSYGRSSTEMQTRIEDMLQRSKLMLVIDEAHHLFSAAERVYSRPELVDWLNTACYNHGVPSACVCTPQFTIRMARVQRQTSWNADQFQGRTKRFVALPAKPRKQDIEAVTRKLIPDADKNCIDYIVGHALTSKLNLSAVVDAIDEARLLAKRQGSARILFKHVEAAITDYCAPSAAAMERSFSTALIGKRPGPKRSRPGHAADLESEAPARTGRKTNLTGLAPVGNPPGSRRASVIDDEPVEV